VDSNDATTMTNVLKIMVIGSSGACVLDQAIH